MLTKIHKSLTQAHPLKSADEELIKVYYGSNVYKGFLVTKSTTAQEVVDRFLDQVGRTHQVSPAAYPHFELRVYKDGVSKPVKPHKNPLRIQRKRSKRFGSLDYHFVFSVKSQLLREISKSDARTQQFISRLTNVQRTIKEEYKKAKPDAVDLLQAAVKQVKETGALNEVPKSALRSAPETEAPLKTSRVRFAEPEGAESESSSDAEDLDLAAKRDNFLKKGVNGKSVAGLGQLIMELALELGDTDWLDDEDETAPVAGSETATTTSEGTRPPLQKNSSRQRLLGSVAKTRLEIASKSDVGNLVTSAVVDLDQEVEEELMNERQTQQLKSLAKQPSSFLLPALELSTSLSALAEEFDNPSERQLDEAEIDQTLNALDSIYKFVTDVHLFGDDDALEFNKVIDESL